MYLKYLEDNLNHKFTKEMEEYKKYIKIFYNEKAKCPKDLKTLINKKQDEKTIELWCTNWKIIITKPNILNLILLYESLTNDYKKNGVIFKNKLKENMNSSIYKPENDDEIEKILKNLKENENKIDDIKEIFNKEKNMIDEIIKNRQEIIKKIAEIKIKKENIYKNCIDISNIIYTKLKEISKNERNITEQRYTQISKSVELSLNDTKNWIIYFSLIIEYLKENNELNSLNKGINDLKNKFELINNHFIIDPPKIISSNEKKSK